MQALNENPLGWREWIKMQERHQKEVNKIYSSTSSRIDNKLPSVPSISKNTSRSVYGSTATVREIDQKNAKILEKLTKLARAPVSLKTLPVAANKVNKRRFFLKKLENVQMHNDNLRLATRLVKTSSSVNFKKFEEEFVKSQKYCKIRQKF